MELTPPPPQKKEEEKNHTYLTLPLGEVGTGTYFKVKSLFKLNTLDLSLV